MLVANINDMYDHMYRPHINHSGYSTAQFKLYTRVLAHLTLAKVKKLACARNVACDFGVRTQDSKHTQHTRDARHKLVCHTAHVV